MRIAVCDQEAFYPLRSLVEGPLKDWNELNEVERLIRTVVLHDEISMELQPIPYEPEADEEFTEEEKRAGGRSVIVALGPVLDGYDFFRKKGGPWEPLPPDIQLSSALIDTARKFSNADEGNVYYKAHIDYLRRVVNIVKKGGSALLAGEFGAAAVIASTQFPAKLFENLDQSWQQFAREADAGDIGLVVPPMLSIILTRSARREAIPAIIKDLRAELAESRSKAWALIDRLKAARTIGEAQEIRQELNAASKVLSLGQDSNKTRPVRVLWDLIAGGASGAATAILSGSDVSLGAAVGALGFGARSVPPLIDEFGATLFGRGAFDLANRIRREVGRVEYTALGRLLSNTEKEELGIGGQA